MHIRHLRERLKQRLPKGAKAALRPMVFQARLMRLAVRRAMPSQRMAPSFVIVGAMKAGTTSLFNYLLEHPRIHEPLVKEIDFFSYNWQRGSAWYQSHFPRRDNIGDGITGEASTGYVAHPLAAARMHSLYPDMRIVVLLRDPVRRAISHYHHERNTGRERRAIGEAMQAPQADAPHTLPEADELNWYLAFQSSRPGRKNAELAARHDIPRAYVRFSRYAEQLEPWLKLFGREQVLALRSEDLFANPAATTARVHAFLNLSDAAAPAAMQFNPGLSRDPDPAVELFLQDTLAASTDKLRTLLGDEWVWPAGVVGKAE